MFAPGLLVAATGVGAGDLITNSIVGSTVGVGVLWGAVLGAVMKWSAAEGIARWQMATGTTLLEGWNDRLGAWVRWCFLAYFVIWCLSVGSALVNGCGIAGAAILPVGDAQTSKVVWGVAHSLVGLALVWFGGFKSFERAMSALVGVMFVSVLLTALFCRPDWSAVAEGLFVPSMPTAGRHHLLAVLGGVGGTVTLLSYGYWIAEIGRHGQQGLRTSRIDLAAGYLLTAFFGVAMIVIGSRIQMEEGDGFAELATRLAEQLELVLGPAGRWIFLFGFWGAVFTSLLGVWQSAPYLFADWRSLARGDDAATRARLDLAQTRDYRLWLVAMAIVPLFSLGLSVKMVQYVYAVLGGLFIPLVALTLLLLNNRGDWVGREFKNGWFINALLVATLAFFAYVGIVELLEQLTA
ncbi:MAG: Nramp family divalent metal transporter [Pirellulales bacterium]|nr:Nramp family divalent metal transporter [Pirellulales bacterium]